MNPKRQKALRSGEKRRINTTITPQFFMKRFYLYEGNNSLGRQESDSFNTKREAIKKPKLVIEEAKFSLMPTGYGYQVYVIDRNTGEFLHTEEL